MSFVPGTSEEISLSLPTPTQFPAFPYSPPYPIQVDLMRHLYTSIEQKKVTIVESPTGTGKTLSLLCASLTWLGDEKNRAKKGILDALGTETDAGHDWVLAQTRERRARELEGKELEYAQRLAEARKKEEAMKRMASSRVHKKAKTSEATPVSDADPDDIFLPESTVEEDDNISPEVRALMARIEKGTSRKSFFDEEEDPTCTKIYYASRTHSQLAQILPELRRLKLSPVVATPTHCSSSVDIPQKRAAPDDLQGEDEMPVVFSRTISLGSRKQLCINDNVRSKSKDLDEGCRELLEEKGDKRCPYLPPIGEESRMVDFRDQILASPKDIEDLASVGRLAHTCPYFGSRRAIPQAELITLPYNLLLQKTAREALGIDLTDQIVIIDEAHNLIPTLLSLSTARLPFSTLSTSFQQVCIYVSKFRTRLSAQNMLNLRRLVMFLDALQKYAVEWKEKNTKSNGSKAEVMTAAELVDRLGRKASGVNLLEIEGYLKRSKIARKISGYSDKEAEKQSDPKLRPRRGAVPPLHAVEAFLLALTGTNDDGRVTFSLVPSYSPSYSGQEDVEIKYQLLNPAPHFLEVVECARSVILAGGTMSPISDVINQLFAQLPPDKITSFSCGHIIPESNLQTIVVGKGPRGGDLEYKAGKQGDETVIAELGQILQNFAALVPRGMIVFFPSYHFLNTARAVWQKSGAFARFESKKKVFFEPEQSTQVDQVLQDYSSAVHETNSTPTSQVKSKGGLLFAVIGAKLSEGLNFADDLARAVVIVGLPFANLSSPELRERMKYVKELEAKRGTKRPPGQKDAAAELYENMCMNAVNQSIGRAIRHKGDWASLILLDQRYGSASIRAKLPKWIGGRMTVADGFGQAIRELGSFYKNKKI
ncbi:helicase C-terminal domain-containing protein [Mycena albidolilacea]|uniref:ATP-dependent DNA helicase CHL1 n=1 Tax=Mycena albidolilacea TaxID=1033008 RepID=A0AAD7F5F8_9AGAR|nr:helicase C-terminal domain-containing protein [Mycena albidolilacea]